MLLQWWRRTGWPSVNLYRAFSWEERRAPAVPGKKRKKDKAWSRGKGKENDNATARYWTLFLSLGQKTVEEERKQDRRARRERQENKIKKAVCLIGPIVLGKDTFKAGFWSNHIRPKPVSTAAINISNLPWIFHWKPFQFLCVYEILGLLRCSISRLESILLLVFFIYARKRLSKRDREQVFSSQKHIHESF